MAEPQRDAFGNIISLDSDLDKPTTYNIYENRPFSTGLGASLQDVYGVQGGLPMFQFIRQVKTGERTYDPRRPEDRRFRDQYEQYRQQNPQAPTFAQAIGEVFIGGGVPVVGATIEGIVNPGGYYQGDTLSRAGQGALDTFSDSPQQLVQSQIGGFDTNLYNLKPDQAFIPELADIKTATATGNKDLFNILDPAKETLTTQEKASLTTVISQQELQSFQDLINQVPVSENVIEYAVKLVSMTRPTNELAPQITKDWLDWGAGPRASTFLIMAAQAKCLLAGKSTPDIDDIKDIAKPILRHRIITNFTAEADGISKEDVLDQLIDQLKI